MQFREDCHPCSRTVVSPLSPTVHERVPAPHNPREMAKSASSDWPDLSTAEREAIVLMSVVELTADLVNNEMLTVYSHSRGAVVQFRTGAHQRVFSILLVDLLSATDRQGPVVASPFLSSLAEIVSNPQFNIDGSVRPLSMAVESFRKWLGESPALEFWFPSIDRTLRVTMPRVQALKLVGNLSKHDPLRAVGVARDLSEALSLSNEPVSVEEALLALGDFYRHFYTDFLAYHGSTLAEFINNIRWGIHDYLLPEFKRAFAPVVGKEPMYGYEYPTSIGNRFAREKYWDLMNSVRSRPYVPRFEVDAVFKQRY